MYGELDVPASAEDLGPTDGLTLEAAIGELLQRNLGLNALRYEIPMARADVLTAGLRANPIFYADAQLVPYGTFSNARPGGQTQYDINITYPLDLSHKRRARIAVAEAAKHVTEAQFQDAVRQQVDNLYTAFVDVVTARLTLAYSQEYARGIERLYQINLDLLNKGQIIPATTEALHVQVEQSELQTREAAQALVRATQTLALMLDLPADKASALQVRGALRDVRPLPATADSLIGVAMTSRPDLASYRLGLERAQADARLARANRNSDVFLLYQPYTFQDNAPFGQKSAHSWAVGATVMLPMFNRNQGNIQRTAMNVAQTRVELASLERKVAFEVDQAVREFQLSLERVLEYEQQILPSSRRVRDTAYRRFQGGEVSVLEYLAAQKDFNAVVRDYRDAMVRHRRSMLDLNTAVGAPILP
jgi:cobalt-zinc-cadmium efflux system outer membrane protein